MGCPDSTLANIIRFSGLSDSILSLALLLHTNPGLSLATSTSSYDLNMPLVLKKIKNNFFKRFIIYLYWKGRSVERRRDR